jgi:hypothetical protein
MAKTSTATTDALAQTPGPPDPSLVKACETLVQHALESRREICKLMLTTTVASLGAYLAILGLILDKSAIKAYFIAHAALAATPVFLFLLAAACYVGGYFHNDAADASRVLGWLERRDTVALQQAVSVTLDRRWKFLLAGNILFWFAVCIGLVAAYYAAVS